MKLYESRDDIELRKECLKLAVESAPENAYFEHVVYMAEIFRNYVRFGEVLSPWWEIEENHEGG